jgi:hypothetical protein
MRIGRYAGFAVSATVLAPGASLALTGPGISTKPDARAENISSILHTWFSNEWADARGGIQVLADEWAGQGTKAAGRRLLVRPGQ